MQVAVIVITFWSFFTSIQGGDYVVIGEDVEIPRGGDENGTVGANVYHYWVWDVKQNEVWRIQSCSTSGTQIALGDNYLCLQDWGNGFKVYFNLIRQSQGLTAIFFR